MNIREIIKEEKERLEGRKQSEYMKGRIRGMHRGPSMLKFSLIPSEYDLLAFRVDLKRYMNGEMQTEFQGFHPDYLSGFRKSIRNLYHTAGFLIQDPMMHVNPVSADQRILIAILEKESGEEFEGLTKEEASIWIRRIKNEEHRGSTGQIS